MGVLNYLKGDPATMRTVLVPATMYPSNVPLLSPLLTYGWNYLEFLSHTYDMDMDMVLDDKQTKRDQMLAIIKTSYFHMKNIAHLKDYIPT